MSTGQRLILGGLGLTLVGLLLALSIVSAFPLPGPQWAQADPDLHDWFLTLHAKGSRAWCCDLADGAFTQQDIRNGHWWTTVGGQWVEVPDSAVVTEPNRLGRPIVWASEYEGIAGHVIQIRCFLPGALG